jgi:hypothetical protein
MPDPLRALLNERYGCNQWWTSPRPELDDSALMQGIRRVALNEALDGVDDELEAI